MHDEVVLERAVGVFIGIALAERTFNFAVETEKCNTSWLVPILLFVPFLFLRIVRFPNLRSRSLFRLNG